MFVQKVLDTRPQIASFLASPKWTSQQLLKPASLSESTTPSDDLDTSPALVAKLLKQSGLTASASTTDAIIKDLRSQLVFVNHICEVDTSNYTPLVRLGDNKCRVKVTIADLVNANENAPTKPAEWKPVDLASEKNGPFYVLKEGLKRD
ncbi:hypothetical protein DV451_000214 [Geotrichum candidum]|uniref:Similar to Saccharomyces cerevisiae YGR102C GTF1 Subunit of the trimeric GatFAB AmidoTransferase(AdT) complex, involved in the formation of Q-tRNAQ n=1 Tax=Geotrichum candidum TaxID=1173061 RepID=A0A0J9XGH4_GEOCN|nr:hypothetical protein DV451_000214 [Geotrichum candidum]KAI9210115.1 hypothetical protein DS838_005004 [Geotrichum bryndzae]KAF5106244.1 hypothetical protein DV453_004096 [Geotrichum candidum]KAF5113396.1 hypothetical protein DV452_003684 [Geotrichum candidum]KAF5117205.1 hypothetical protein DV495_005029 [Geotrichum candidum]